MKKASKNKQQDHDAAKEATKKKASSSTSSSATKDKKKLSTSHAALPSSSGAHTLTRQQVVELLKVFWVELLQNNVRQVKKILVANLHSMDFRAAKYAPAADGSALHLCAQHGFLAMARLLVDMNIVDLNAQNKVGSTSLHVACKFGQDAMLLFLLELGARVDVPDSQNRIAFDVAPFAVVDRCILAPRREQQRVAQEENDGFREQEAAASAALEEAQREYCNAEMALADAESWAIAERELLRATRAIDNEWSHRIQSERDELERHREVYREHLNALGDIQERIDSAREQLMAAVKRDKKVAQDGVDRLKLRVHEVEQVLDAEQQELDDQLGLVDAASALPNDPDVQEWVLSAMIAMIEEDEWCTSDVNGMTRSARLLARKEIGIVISNVLVRFANTRHLQWRALQCLSDLVRHVVAVIEMHRASTDVTRTLLSFLDTLLAANKTKLSNALVLCRDALARFSNDVEINALVAAVYYHLLRLRQSSDDGGFCAPLAAVRFSHENRNQKLPLDMLRLYEQSRRLGTIQWTDGAWIEAVRDAAFLLFTVAKSNATKALLANDAITTAIIWIDELSSMGLHTASTGVQCVDGVKTAATHYLLGALSFLHSVPWSPTANSTVKVTGKRATDSSACPLEGIHPWSAKDIQTLLNAVAPLLPTLGKVQRGANDGDDAGAHARQASHHHRMLVGFWLLKLLRNLALHLGQAARAVRIELFAPPVFSVLADAASALVRFAANWSRQSQDVHADNDSECRQHTNASGVPGLGAVVGVWMDLAEVVWVRHYDADGKLRATAVFVMEHVLAQLSWQMKHLDDLRSRDATLAACSRTLSAVALVLSNDKNACLLRDHNAVLDEAVHAFLRWMLTLRTAVKTADGDVSDGNGVSSTTVFEALAHVLRIYLASLRDQLASSENDEGAGRIAVQQLHDRCRAVGICAVLRAFHMLDGDREGASERGEESNAESPRVVGHVGSLKRMRAVVKATGAASPSSASDERRVLRALSRAVVELVRCKC